MSALATYYEAMANDRNAAAGLANAQAAQVADNSESDRDYKAQTGSAATSNASAAMLGATSEAGERDATAAATRAGTPYIGMSQQADIAGKNASTAQTVAGLGLNGPAGGAAIAAALRNMFGGAAPAGLGGAATPGSPAATSAAPAPAAPAPGAGTTTAGGDTPSTGSAAMLDTTPTGSIAKPVGGGLGGNYTLQYPQGSSVLAPLFDKNGNSMYLNPFDPSGTPRPQRFTPDGQPVKAFAQGTSDVSGPSKGGKTDTIPAMLSPGEAVLNRGATEHLGKGVVDHLNKLGAMRMAAQDEVAAHVKALRGHSLVKVAKAAQPKADQGQSSAAATTPRGKSSKAA